MTKHIRALFVITALALAPAPALAQSTSDGWKTVIYPVLGWFPVFGAEFPSIPDGGGGGGSVDGGGIDSKLNGALLFGASVEKGPWRVDGDGMWAALRGERPLPPQLDVDLDLIYGHVMVGRRFYRNFYVTGGVRRLAAGYTIQLAGFPEFSRKPGLWDPLVGVAWHQDYGAIELHASFEGGGFGVGAEQDIFGGGRIDWKPIPHFRLTAGYGAILLKIEDSVLNRPFTVRQTLQGPIVGFGFHF